MRLCNYCDWQRLKKLGYRIATEKDLDRIKEKGFQSGVVIVNRKGEFAVWYAELPKQCRC